MNAALMTEGQVYRGFLVTKYLSLKELNSTLIELVHESTGARIIQIANDDPENLFALSFQTLPESSNGVAHALEHIVLCGSKKFSVKDPFFSMTRRSLNTYMNALTGQDFTVYPASSAVEKDFYNLLEVYLDAVFHPLLKPLSFCQEAHRFCFTEKGNILSPLEIQGVVYNEMKGAMNSSDERMSLAMLKHLMPDLPYAYNSGGDPKEIASLSYDELREFHRTFYHPSRCLFFFYGNLPLSKHLDFLERHALTGVEKIAPLSPLPLQTRMKAPIHIEDYYPIETCEDLTKKTIIALGYLTAPISHQSDLLALTLIDHLLTDTDVSPLKLALLKSKLCTTVESHFDPELSEAPWILVCKGCEEKNRDSIVQLTRKTLETLAIEGFDSNAIEAALHQLEFDRTEIGGDSIPFGLILFFRSVLPKQHGAETERSLLIHSLFRDLREHLKDPSYLSNMLRRYFLENPHTVYLSLKPDPQLNRKENEEERSRIATLQSHLSQKDLLNILEQEKKLAHHQEEIEHQSLECLPQVTLQDIQPHAKDYPLTISSFGPLHTYYHPCFTNRIIYADLFFDLPEIDFHELPLLSLFTRFWIEVGCGGRTYEQTLEWHQSVLGDISSSISVFIPHDDPTVCSPAISLRAKALDRNQSSLLDVLRDTSLSPDFQNPHRIQELLLEHATELENRLLKNAMSYAIQLASSGLSIPGAFQYELQGLPYYQWVQKVARSSPKPLIQEFHKMKESIIGAPKPSLVLSCGSDEESHLRALLEPFGSTLPQRSLSKWKANWKPSKIQSQGKIISSPVAFSALAFQTISYQHSDSAYLLIAAHLMENLVLHREIREKGGAYGSGATYSPASGHFYFYSYRDPHLFSTYQAFLAAIDRIANGQFTAQELFEAKLGILQDVDAPLPPRQRAISAFGWLKSGRTLERRDAYRHSIIDAPKEIVASAVQKHLLNQKEKGIFVSFASKELFDREAGSLPFDFQISSP